MNLYLISQKENNDHDTYDSAVVVAKSEAEAKRIHPGGYLYQDCWDSTCWATKIENVKVEFLGKANKNLFEGEVICASFNAG